MQLSCFLTGVFEQGRAVVSQEDAIWDDAALELLKETELAARANAPGTAPRFDLAAAQWAAEIIYYACQALVCRHLGPEKVQERLRRPCPEPVSSPAAIYSADLLLRYLPNIWQLAKRIAADDPLVAELRGIGAQWPLSSVGIEGIEQVDASPVLGHPTLQQLYVDRIIARNDQTRMKEDFFAKQAAKAVGAHRELYPKLAAHFAETEGAL